MRSALLATAGALTLLLALGSVVTASDAEARLLRDINEGKNGSAWSTIGEAGDQLYFVAGERGSRFNPRKFGMWVTDGTRRGTRRIHDPSDSWGDSGPRVDLVGEDDDDLLFAKRAPPCQAEVWKPCGGGFNPWRSDGTAAGTHPILDESSRLIGISSGIVRSGDELYFGGFHQEHGNALFRLRSGESVAHVVRRFSPKLVARWGKPRPLAALGDRVVFAVDDRTHGQELWATDGTEEGTAILADIAEGKKSMYLDPNLGYEAVTAVIDGHLIFQSHLNESQNLGTWSTDGTTAGTERVSEGLLDLRSGLPTVPLVVAGGDAQHGREPWLTDGTRAGTQLLRDIAPGPADGFSDRYTIDWLDRPLRGWLAETAAGPYRYFIGDDGVHGPEPWLTDGTTEGTRLLADIDSTPGRGSDPTKAAAVGERLFFVADDGVHGRQLWVTEGEPIGTRMVSALDLGGRVPHLLSTFGDGVLLGLEEPDREMSLWRIDSAAEGVMRIWKGKARGMELQELDGTVFFVPRRAAEHTRLWMSDGTRKGTSEVTAPKGRRLRFDAGARPVSRVGDRFVFYADDGRTGLELWTLPVPGA